MGGEITGVELRIRQERINAEDEIVREEIPLMGSPLMMQ